MKKRYPFVLFVVGIICALGLPAPVRSQSIVGSAHDFSGRTWSGGQICVPCHTPHNAQGTDVPLWNHDSSRENFVLYSSATLNATVGQPSSVSKACLSCHDGSVALDSFGGNAGAEYISGDANLGTDLSDDHPISFTYDSALAADDGGLFDPGASSGIGGTIDTDLLYAHKVECSSCHNPHNESGVDHLLVKSNAGSDLCLTCHDK
ncbi:MAG: cytochrome c3 family protein [Candidatus Marinimicrobia bacterium]|nr:cytochrome c3 family protein [Candidatus Neomarinimicrobiota bacterium]